LSALEFSCSSALAGFYLVAGHARADVDAVMDFGFGTRAGSVSMDGYSLGAYYTHIGPSGRYVDAVLQGTRYGDIAATSQLRQSQRLDTDGWGMLASLEGGYPVTIGDGFILEPQAQIVYQHIDLADSADAFGQIAFQNSDAWFGRLGARLSRDWTLEDGRKLTAWARAGLWSGFGAEAQTTFSNPQGLGDTTFGTDLGDTLAQFDVGVSSQLSDKVSAFAVGSYDLSLTDTGGHGFGPRIGLKGTW
jgi:autotransporter family porin